MQYDQKCLEKWPNVPKTHPALIPADEIKLNPRTSFSFIWQNDINILNIFLFFFVKIAFQNGKISPNVVILVPRPNINNIVSKTHVAKRH
jgi:hypothetical protein